MYDQTCGRCKLSCNAGRQLLHSPAPPSSTTQPCSRILPLQTLPKGGAGTEATNNHAPGTQPSPHPLCHSSGTRPRHRLCNDRAAPVRRHSRGSASRRAAHPPRHLRRGAKPVRAQQPHLMLCDNCAARKRRCSRVARRPTRTRAPGACCQARHALTATRVAG